MPPLTSDPAAPLTAADDRAARDLLDPELNDHEHHDKDVDQGEATQNLLEHGGDGGGYGHSRHSIWIVYSYANMWAIIRTMLCFPVVGLAGYMLVPGPAQHDIVLPCAALTLAVVSPLSSHPPTQP